MGETKVLLKKFLMALAIALYSVVPVVAGDNDRARGHGQGHGAKMGNLKAGEEGLISRYKREYQLAVRRSLTRHQRPLVGGPSHQFPMDWNKGAGLHWDKGAGKGWCKGYGKNSNKRYGMGTDKGGKREDQSRGDKWQKNRKKKSFDTD